MTQMKDLVADYHRRSKIAWIADLTFFIGTALLLLWAVLWGPGTFASALLIWFLLGGVVINANGKLRRAEDRLYGEAEVVATIHNVRIVKDKGSVTIHFIDRGRLRMLTASNLDTHHIKMVPDEATFVQVRRRPPLVDGLGLRPKEAYVLHVSLDDMILLRLRPTTLGYPI